MRVNWFLSYILIVLISCEVNDEVKQMNDSTQKIQSIKPDIAQESFKDSLDFYFSKLDFYNIKMNFGGSTTAVLSKKEASDFMKSDSCEFGFYYLINNKLEDVSPFKGEAIVEFCEKPWNYATKSENLLELMSYSKELVLLQNLTVGDKKEKCFRIYGEPDYNLDNAYFYRKNEYILSLNTEHDTITQLRIGKYNFEPDSVVQLFQKLNTYWGTITRLGK